MHCYRRPAAALRVRRETHSGAALKTDASLEGDEGQRQRFGRIEGRKNRERDHTRVQRLSSFKHCDTHQSQTLDSFSLPVDKMPFCFLTTFNITHVLEIRE